MMGKPLRARLVERAEEWRWSSATGRPRFAEALLSDGPVARPRDWRRRLNTPQTAAEEAMVRRGVIRGTPVGSERWVQRTAARLGLQFTLRPQGRPKKAIGSYERGRKR